MCASVSGTVSVHVQVTGVPFPVAVRVSLVAVGHVGTVVAGVPVGVAVRVLLVLVGDQPTVVLKSGRRVRSCDRPARSRAHAHTHLHVFDAVSVGVLVTLVPNAVSVCVLLPGVGRVPAVVLTTEGVSLTADHGRSRDRAVMTSAL